jgi:hypothetical protein
VLSSQPRTATPTRRRIEHDDGTISRYLHLKKWSVMVYPGLVVGEGQPLGMIGSSGRSRYPHLHFDVFKDSAFHEPHAGPCRTGDSLWQSQPDHVFYDPVVFVNAGLTTVDPTLDDRWKFRPPDVYHVKRQTTEIPHYLWYFLTICHVGDEMRTIYRDPSGAVFRDVTTTVDLFNQFLYELVTTNLPPSGPVGIWTVEFRINEVTRAQFSFVYDDVDYQNPVVQPRTFGVDHGVFSGDLRGADADSGLFEFRVVTPPAHGRVALHGPRQSYFTYRPDSGYEGLDTFQVEVEDGQEQVSAPATVTLDVAPVTGNALRLEGEDGHVLIPDDASARPTTALTLEALVRRTTGSAGLSVLFERTFFFVETGGFSLEIQPDSTLRFRLGDGIAATFAQGTTPVPLDRWTHVAATWDGLMMRLFVDGAQEPDPVPFAGPIFYPADTTTLLGASWSPGDSFRGEIDEMRIWNVGRTPEQLLQGATCSFYENPPPSTLVGWWRFNGSALDESGYANHGSLIEPAHFLSTDGYFRHGDGVGDACDVCVSSPDSVQADSDWDGVGDACDLCPFLGDTERNDTDSDGTGDLCDPAPADPASGVPSSVSGLMLAHDAASGNTTLTWAAEPLASSYLVFRSSLEQVKVRYFGRCDSSVDPDPTDTAYVDAEVPAPGELSAYVVLGVGTGGVHGRAGHDSEGRERDMRANDCL